MYICMDFPGAQMLKSLPAMGETQVQSLDLEHPLEKEVTTNSNILAWEIPWTEERDGVQSMRSQRVRHDQVTNIPICMHIYVSNQT